MKGIKWTIGALISFLVLGLVAVSLESNLLAVIAIFILLLAPVLGSGEYRRLVEDNHAK